MANALFELRIADVELQRALSALDDPVSSARCTMGSSPVTSLREVEAFVQGRVRVRG